MKMKKSIVVLLVVLAIIGVAAAIGIAASKQNGQGQNNNDQGCKPGSAPQSCYTGPAGTAGVGACMAGTKTCNRDGEWSRCIGQVTPIAEVCDNSVDDDCDGTVNDGCSTPCSPPDDTNIACPGVGVGTSAQCGSGSYCTPEFVCKICPG